MGLDLSSYLAAEGIDPAAALKAKDDRTPDFCQRMDEQLHRHSAGVPHKLYELMCEHVNGVPFYDHITAYHFDGLPWLTEQLEQGLRAADPKTVVDIGCGTALQSVFLSTQFPDATFYGIDLEEAMTHVALERAQRHQAPFHVLRGDSFELPFADGSIDAALAIRSMMEGPLEGRDNSYYVLDEAYRVLRPGGSMLTLVECYQEEYIEEKRFTLEQLLLGTEFVDVQHAQLTFPLHLGHDVTYLFASAKK